MTIRKSIWTWLTRKIPYRIKRYIQKRRTELRASTGSIIKLLGKMHSLGIPFLIITILACLIYDVGYNEFYISNGWFYSFWRSVLVSLLLLFCMRLGLTFNAIGWRSRIFNILTVLLIAYMIALFGQLSKLMPREDEGVFTLDKILIYSGSIFLIVTEGSHAIRNLYQRIINPALLFVGSFFVLIIGGAFLLMLPNATVHGITPIDAWFTAASAVCVTGLVSVDTATTFTVFGKIIIISLIQIGGVGVMTFAGLLTYLAAGSVSFANQLALKDMLSSTRLTNMVGFVIRVITVTLTFEALGAILLYTTLADSFLTERSERFLFAIFHSVSAFCNAGFSTLSDGLFDISLRLNYAFQLIICGLIILGGLGFPIVFNLASAARIRITNMGLKVLRLPRSEYHPKIIHASSKLAIFTSVILLVTGSIAFLILETDASLKQHPTILGKIVTSFFASVTPRTAGFNTVDLTTMKLPTVLVYMTLMWIGASPGSTGGGIKTTVAAVAFLNLRAVILGKRRIEVFRTQVSDSTTQRAFAIILASALIIVCGILMVSFQDSDKGLIKIAFEVISAYSTVGLTLGITAKLSASSKLILSIVMLMGRVGTLTLFFALVTPAKEVNYRYPSEDILL